MTASFGVVRLLEGEDEDALMRRVDAALYQAKHEGRNRVVAACDLPLAGIAEIDRKSVSEDYRLTGELL